MLRLESLEVLGGRVDCRNYTVYVASLAIKASEKNRSALVNWTAEG
jgi:hypothetical protein